MKRRIWLILTVAILFGIEAPLCALACVDAGNSQFTTLDASTGSTPSAGHADPIRRITRDTQSNQSNEANQGHRSQAPCHGSQSAPASNDAPGSHQDCGCDFAVEGLVSDSPSGMNHSLVGWTPMTHTASDVVFAADRQVAKAISQSNLPSPDILLLKSTLLI